jgi:hypothetical protein
LLDVSGFPAFPEFLDVDVAGVGGGENPLERAVRALAHVDQRSEHVEGDQLGRQARSRHYRLL